MNEPTASAPWMATLAYTPDQNGGAVSMLDGRVSLPAVMGLLAAGEPPEIVAAEYCCTVEAVRVIAQLLEDFRDGLFVDDEPADPADVDALVALTLRELEADIPVDLVPRVVARKAVEVTLRAVTEAPDETQAAVAASYAKGRSDGFNACRAGAPNPNEENNHEQ